MSLPRLAPDFAPAAKADFRIGWVLVLLASREAASFAAVQSQAIQARAGRQPITAIASGPEPRRVALGEQYLADRRLSRDHVRSSRSRDDIRTNGASANAHDTTPHRLTPFNVALNFGAERP
jgi:cytochrome c peroxidase